MPPTPTILLGEDDLITGGALALVWALITRLLDLAAGVALALLVAASLWVP